MKALYTLPVKKIDNSEMTLCAYQNKVLLVVNVASRCGFTPQYKELEALHREYEARGFSVLGFPCDQFMHQEPENNAGIQAFAESCFNITFPLFAKIDVKGPHQAPIYQYLQKHIEKKPWKFIPWNFTKVLIASDGRVICRFLPTTSFTTIRKTLGPLLSSKA